MPGAPSTSQPSINPVPNGALGNTGEIYGTQQFALWAAGDVTPRQVCDALKPVALWRFSCFGRVKVTIDYGTQGTRKIFELRAPLVITIPGQFTATAEPIDDTGADCVVTLTQATAGAQPTARRLADATAGAVGLDNGAVRYWALTASTLTIAGVAVVVPALAIVPLVSGAVLNTGSGFQEFEA